jgi:integrase
MDKLDGGGHMAGSMRQRGNDSWQLRVHAGRDQITGKKHYVERTFRGTKREASKALAALVGEAQRLSPKSGSKGTMEALLNEWLEQATPSFSPKTVTTSRTYINNAIVPAIGTIPASKLSPHDLDRFYRQLLEIGAGHGPYSPATIRRVHGIVRRALTQGVRWGWLAHNPAIDASPPRVPVKDLQPPTPEEVVELFKAAQESHPALATFIILAASSGARRGELIALRWKDIDLEHGVVNIERGIVLAGGQLIEQGTKTHQSRRVTLDGPTRDALEEHRSMADAESVAVGVRLGKESFVFSDAPDGSVPWRPDSTSRAFRELCRRTGVSGVRLHDLRHYVATRLLASGIDVRTVAGRLGHRNPATTLNVYAHFVPEADSEAAGALGALFEEALRSRRPHRVSTAKPLSRGVAETSAGG